MIRNADLRVEMAKSQARGEITPELARMFVQLVQNLSNRSNWRGYSYIDEMRAEAHAHFCRGFMSYNPEKSDNVFAWMTSLSWNAFRKILLREKKIQQVVDEIHVAVGVEPSHGYMVQYEIDCWDSDRVLPPSEGLVMKPGRGWGGKKAGSAAEGASGACSGLQSKPRGRPRRQA